MLPGPLKRAIPYLAVARKTIGLGVIVGVEVSVGVGVNVAVGVEVDVGVGVKVAVGVEVGVGV
jgi:hypothetical protein